MQKEQAPFLFFHRNVGLYVHDQNVYMENELFLIFKTQTEFLKIDFLLVLGSTQVKVKKLCDAFI